MPDPIVPPADPQGDPPANPPAAKTFTQEQLDQIVKDRLDRERSKYADYEDAKKAATRLKELEAASMSEAEKVAKAIADRDARLVELEAKAREAEERAIGLVRQSKVIAIASTLGAYDPQDLTLMAAVAGIDPASPTADADIKAALESLQKTKPYLFKPAGARALESFNPAGTPGQSAETDAQRAQRVLKQTQGAGKGWGPFG